ncbi:hypothetical protein GO730_00560 [Spirosoma sp. HMF3257]|uniref:Uncharacterized protein n=2 Tax=Spirosoma telluris TaxID=2183553 RepID=A0A327NV74_9BACT|nr:hypothetical protein [Spirosoma telluris]RAI78299.1 hypothetical protein HMF3257_00545 [Spirosoma telluris]
MLETLVKAKRCTTDELEMARRRLADLKEQTTFVPIVPRADRVIQPLAVEPVATGRQIVGDEYASIQADLAAQANTLNRKMAELSNQLHKIPSSVSCPELTRQILELKAQIELIWDKKYYLERNHCLPEEPTDQEQSTDNLATLSDAGQYQLAYEKRRLIDLRSKLKRKLLNPKAKSGKVIEWETELAQCTLKIQEIEFKLS